jgi:PAS domain S-box-containing protein
MARSPVPSAPDPGRLAAGPTGDGHAEAAELAEVRTQLREAYETIEAIRGGGVDSLVIGPPGQERVYTLASADRPYRLILEAMNEGAATVSPRGLILDANPRLGSMTGRAATEMVGTPVLDLIPPAQRATFTRLLGVGAGERTHGETELTGPAGTLVPVLLAVSAFDLDGMLLRCLVLTDLTIYRQAADQAHSASRYARNLIEASLDPLVTISPDGKITDVNEATVRATGVDRDHLIGTDFSDYFTEPGQAREGYRQVFAQGSVTDYPLTIRHTNGTLTDVLYNASLYKDTTGDVAGVFAAARDITAQKQAEDELRSTSQYARSLIEASLDPLVTIGQDGKITDVNAATERVTGYGRAELLGTEFSDYFTEPDLARAGYQQAFRDGSVHDYSLELRHRDGHITSVLYNASLYRDPSGHVLGVFAAARDVTQIKRAQAALRESEERLNAVFDNAPVGIDDISPSGEFMRANPHFRQITGYTAEELRSLRPSDLIHPDDRGADLASTQRLLSGEIDSYSMEKRYLKKDGGVVWAEVNRAVVRSSDGAPLLVVGVVRDITAQRRAEAEVKTLNAELEARVEQRTAELERANQNLEAFTYSVSHDLRAPLRALSGFSEALVEEYSAGLGDTGRDYAARIQAAGERMGTLIDDLLHLSRVLRASMNLEAVDLSAEVAAIAGELRSRDPGRHVRFAIQDGVWVSADPTLIRTVVQNLLDNAWKFTGQRDDATIEFAATTTKDGRVCCYVRDNGAGFDPAYAGKLFQPFQRLHAATDFPGTGIGLASVQRIIGRHGGRTWAEGAVNEGATFYFTLAPKATPGRTEPSPGRGLEQEACADGVGDEGLAEAA